jgi:hypothetical protein
MVWVILGELMVSMSKRVGEFRMMQFECKVVDK